MIEIPTLRPYQQECVANIRREIAKYRSVIFCVPPGAGKTRCAKHMLGLYLNREKKDGESGKAAFMVHRRGLVENASASFDEHPRLPHGVIMSGVDTLPGCDLQVASIDTKNSWYVEKGTYRNDFTYDFLVFDECVSGDSIIETELGAMRIDQVPDRKPKTVRSYSEEKGVHFASVLNWKHSGTKTTLEIHTHAGKVRCTPDHELYTRRGWLQAQYVLPTDEILAYAGVEESLEQESCFVGGINHSEKKSTLLSSGENSMQPLLFANAAVVLGLDLDLRQLTHGSHTVRCPYTNSIATDTKTVALIKCFSLLFLKGRRFLGHCLGTLRSHIQTAGQNLRDLAAHMGLFKKSGQFTKRNSCIDWLQKPKLLITKAGVSSLLSLSLHAINRLLKSKNWLSVEGKKWCPENGSMRLGILGSRGGYVMMDQQQKNRCFFTRKVFLKRKTKLLQTGFVTTSERLLSTKTGQRTHISSESQAGRNLRLVVGFRSTSQNVCDTSWCRVMKIVPASQTEVFDIEVEKSHCFFANNLLVHNCHSHVAKFRTFLVAHNKKRAELGLKPPFILGLSATPQHRELNKVFSKIVMGPSPSWLIENGYLSPFRYFQATQGKLNLLVKRGDDYTEDSVAAAMDGLAGDLVKDWKRLAEGRATVGFFPRRSHAYEAMEILRKNGIDAHYVDGETDDEERKSLFQRLNSGEIQYICNVGVIERGTDIPRVGCVQLCTAIGSVVRYRQMVGRGSRVHPDVPDCIVLDHAANISKHGFFDDDIAWTLEWGERPAKTHEPRATINCPNCNAIYRGGKCRQCGYEPTARERKSQGLEFTGGELREIKKSNVKTEKKLRTSEEIMLIALFKAGHIGGTWGQAWYIAKKIAEQQGTDFRVPDSVEVAGRKYKMIPYGHPDSKRKVRDTYGFTVNDYSDEGNPYRVRK